ncbi:hypothetical protein H310_11031 [Aphanomyces invadans]|uniref:Uncharacterized protein n=1 Tax=Aphanomyces invadans TaxID=157072 RepID=A0A024TNL3_9STRA|nr:hypothetical protein H310_11031 [Aphanomyces invadans]ETV95599.1 hypothetical protein H310_11031 [Aphanomyces invadans]|eukprot:XP_008875792.1 hypothetical protein H310_11031 [Aphanomyces invadans]
MPLPVITSSSVISFYAPKVPYQHQSQKKPRRRYNQALKRAMGATGIPKSNLARWAQQSEKLQSFDGSGKWFNLDGAGRPEEIPDTAALNAFMVKLREA